MQSHLEAVTPQFAAVPPGTTEAAASFGYKVPYYTSREAWVAMTKIKVLATMLRRHMRGMVSGGLGFWFQKIFIH
jgi:hypothetical protein